MNPRFQVMGFQLDVARQIERPEVLFSAVRGTHKLGYNTVQLYLEDAYAFPRHPRIGRPHAYSVEVMQELQRLCASQGQELIPVFPSLGHGSYITGKEGYADYDEGRGRGKLTGCLSPSFPETYTLLQELYEDWCLHIPGRYLHVGLDESDAMGQYHIRTHGAEGFDPAGMFAQHCNRLNAIARSLGRRMILWGDMFYYIPAAIPAIDKDIIVADWYYYPFQDTPAVELFGFRKLDSSRILRQAGLEVWGIPSIWPNCPFPDIRDRWRNLRDWMRYGQSVGLNGIINTEWENSWGFPGTTDLLFRMFGRMCAGELPQDVETAAAEVFTGLSSHPAAGSLAGDLLRLGRYHFTAYRNRKAIHDKPERTISAYSPRRAEFRRNRDDLEGMFGDINDVLKQARDDSSRGILKAVQLSHQTLRLFWKSHALLSEAAARAAGDSTAEGVAPETLLELAGQLERFATDYCLHWEEVRFADQPRPIVEWARRTATALRQWAPGLAESPQRNPLLATPRLEAVLHCRRPALPLVFVTLRWADGTSQENLDVMIPFEPAYTLPDKAWAQSSVHVLPRQEMPQSVEFTVRHYGQVGIGKVSLLWRGRSQEFRLACTEGTHIKAAGSVTWLGPTHAIPGDPLTRPDADKARFEPLPPTR
jgi:hypothetical protein